jgi:hypothetical protein
VSINLIVVDTSHILVSTNPIMLDTAPVISGKHPFMVDTKSILFGANQIVVRTRVLVTNPIIMIIIFGTNQLFMVQTPLWWLQVIFEGYISHIGGHILHYDVYK